MYAGDYNDQYPADWQACQVYVASPSLLVCSKSSYVPPDTNWSGFDFSQSSYTLLPGKPTEPGKQLIVCQYHGNYALADGSSYAQKEYARFPVVAQGDLGLPMPALHAAAKRAETIACINNLHQIASACRGYAGDNADQYPTNFQAIESAFYNPKYLYCPAAGLTVIPTNFAQVDYSNISYTMAQVTRQSDPSTPYITCRYHGIYAQLDGMVLDHPGSYKYPGILLGHPVSQTVMPGGTCIFKALTAYPPETLQFQWRKQQPFDANGEPFTNTIAMVGATNAFLVLTNCSSVDAGYYDVVVSLASGPSETSEMACLAVESLTPFPTNLDSLLCSNNLEQILLAARLISDPFLTIPLDYSFELGWPMTLFCPSDVTNAPPDNWNSYDPARSSYVINLDAIQSAETNVAVVCKVHHFYIRTDNVVILPEPLRMERVSLSGETRILSWTGGAGLYEVQMTPSLTPAHWETVASSITANKLELPATNGSAYFRVLWRVP